MQEEYNESIETERVPKRDKEGVYFPQENTRFNAAGEDP